MAGFTDLSDADLVGKISAVERDLVQARFQHSLNQLENTSSLRVHRRSIARLLTEVRRRELEQGLAKGSLRRQHAVEDSAPLAESEAVETAEQGGFLSGLVDKLTG